MYAIVQVAGFQYKVEKDQVIQVPLLKAEAGATLTLDQVLMVKDGDAVRVGMPRVEGVAVSAEVLSHGKSPKLRGGKFIRRKDNRKTWGHRQDFTELRIASIQG